MLYLPSIQKSWNLGPFVTRLIMVFNELFLFCPAPFTSFDGIIQMVVISFSALLPVSSSNVVLKLHNSRYLRPFFNIFLLVKLFENAVLLRKQKTYHLSPSLSFCHTYPIKIIYYISINKIMFIPSFKLEISDHK